VIFFCHERLGDFFVPRGWVIFFVPTGWVIFFCRERLGDFFTSLEVG
jgi:hypothetical protein